MSEVALSQFHIINVQRRMGDWYFETAKSWEDLVAAHKKWVLDYNYQKVRHVGACRIPFTERKGWSNTFGSRDSSGGETRRRKQHVTKALRRKKALTPLAMQDPRDTAKL